VLGVGAFVEFVVVQAAGPLQAAAELAELPDKVGVGDGQHQDAARPDHTRGFPQGRPHPVGEVLKHAEGQIPGQRGGSIGQGVDIPGSKGECGIEGARLVQGVSGVVQADDAEALLPQVDHHGSQPAAGLQDDPVTGEIAGVTRDGLAGAAVAQCGKLRFHAGFIPDVFPCLACGIVEIGHASSPRKEPACLLYPPDGRMHA